MKRISLKSPQPSASRLYRQKKSTVRLLVARTRRRTTEFLRFTSAGVGNEQVAVVGHKKLLNLTLGGFVHVLLVEGNDRLGNCLTDCVNLQRIQVRQKARELRGEKQLDHMHIELHNLQHSSTWKYHHLRMSGLCWLIRLNQQTFSSFTFDFAWNLARKAKIASDTTSTTIRLGRTRKITWTYYYSDPTKTWAMIVHAPETCNHHPWHVRGCRHWKNGQDQAEARARTSSREGSRAQEARWGIRSPWSIRGHACSKPRRLQSSTRSLHNKGRKIREHIVRVTDHEGYFDTHNSGCYTLQ